MAWTSVTLWPANLRLSSIDIVTIRIILIKVTCPIAVPALKRACITNPIAIIIPIVVAQVRVLTACCVAFIPRGHADVITTVIIVRAILGV
jgi:hypothetical protein